MNRFSALDGWRGICAIFVALFHVAAVMPMNAGFVIRGAWLFVDFFFVLSGFVITHADGKKLTDPQGVVPFIARRFGRLWPLHITMLAILVALEFSRLLIERKIPGMRPAFSPNHSPSSILMNILLIQSLGTENILTWNGPAWSISTEFYTYLVFAGLTVATAGKKLATPIKVLLVAVSLASLVFLSPEGMDETTGASIFRCLYGFFLGSVLYQMWRSGRLAHLSGTVAEIAVIAAVCIFLWASQNNSALTFAAPILFGVGVVIFANTGGLLSRALSLPAVAALGLWSYSIYMIHDVLLGLLVDAGAVSDRILHTHLIIRLNGHALIDAGSAMGNYLLAAAFIATVIAVSSLTWRWVEVPGQRYFRSLARGTVPSRPNTG